MRVSGLYKRKAVDTVMYRRHLGVYWIRKRPEVLKMNNDEQHSSVCWRIKKAFRIRKKGISKYPWGGKVHKCEWRWRRCYNVSTDLGTCWHSREHPDEREKQGRRAFAEDLLHGFPHKEDEGERGRGTTVLRAEQSSGDCRRGIVWSGADGACPAQSIEGAVQRKRLFYQQDCVRRLQSFLWGARCGTAMINKCSGSLWPVQHWCQSSQLGNRISCGKQFLRKISSSRGFWYRFEDYHNRKWAPFAYWVFCS